MHQHPCSRVGDIYILIWFFSTVASYITIMDTYAILNVEKVEVVETINFHIHRLLSSVRWKITFKTKFKDPWIVLATKTMSPTIFYRWFRAIRDHMNHNNKRQTREPQRILYSIFPPWCIKVPFDERSWASKCGQFFWKKKSLDCIAYVEVDNVEKRAILTYKVNSGRLSLRLKFSVKNKFGFVCSF